MTSLLLSRPRSSEPSASSVGQVSEYSQRLGARLLAMLRQSLGLKLYVGLAIAAAFYHVLDRAVGF